MSGHTINVGINLKATSGSVAPIISSLQNQLKGKPIHIPIKIDFRSIKTSDIINQNTAFKALSNTLHSLATNATSSAQAMSMLNSTLGNIQKNIAGISRLSKQAAAANPQVASLGKGIKDAGVYTATFAENVAITTKRFAAFTFGATILYSITSGFYAATKAAVEFDREMVRFKQVSGGSESGIKGIEREISRLSVTWGVSSGDLAKSAVIIKSAGYSARETKIALESLAKTTLSASFDDLASTTEGVIAIMAQFKGGASALEGQLGMLSKISADYAVESRDLVEVIKRAGGAFAATGGSLEELLALFTSIRATTRESAESIATGMRTILGRLEDPEIAARIKKNFHIELYDNGKFIGYYNAIDKLGQVIRALPQGDIRVGSLIKDIGGLRNLSRVIPLLTQFPMAEEVKKAAGKGADKLSEDAIIAQQALLTQVTRVKEGFLDLFRTIAQDSSIRFVLKNVADLLVGISQALKSIQPLVPVLAGVATFAAAKYTMRNFGAIKTGFATGRYGVPAISKMSGGGIVPGSGNTDSVPALLTPGEAVIPKNIVQGYGVGGQISDSHHRQLLNIMLRGKGGKGIYRHLRGSKFIGGGSEGLAFLNKENQVIRVGSNSYERPNSKYMLQPIYSNSYGHTRVEYLPYAPPITKNVDNIAYKQKSVEGEGLFGDVELAPYMTRRQKIMQAFRKRIVKEGLLPGDIHAGNISRYKKKIIAIDPGTFSRIGEYRPLQLRSPKSFDFHIGGYARGGSVFRPGFDALEDRVSDSSLVPGPITGRESLTQRIMASVSGNSMDPKFKGTSYVGQKNLLSSLAKKRSFWFRKFATGGRVDFENNSNLAYRIYNKETQRLKQNLTLQEIEAIGSYTNSSFVNQILETKDFEKFKQHTRSKIHHLDTAIGKGHIIAPTRLYRGENHQYIPFDVNDPDNIGKTFLRKGFTSASLSKGVTTSFPKNKSIIDIPKGFPVAFVESITKKTGELEGILPRNLHLQLTGHEKNVPIFQPAGLVKRIRPRRFATGGAAMGTDTVPAMLTPGEFVLSKTDVRNLGGAAAVDRMRKLARGVDQFSRLESKYGYDAAFDVTKRQASYEAGLVGKPRTFTIGNEDSYAKAQRIIHKAGLKRSLYESMLEQRGISYSGNTPTSALRDIIRKRVITGIPGRMTPLSGSGTMVAATESFVGKIRGYAFGGPVDPLDKLQKHFDKIHPSTGLRGLKVRDYINEIKIGKVPGGLGSFDPDTQAITLKKFNLKTALHELGHAIDYKHGSKQKFASEIAGSRGEQIGNLYVAHHGVNKLSSIGKGSLSQYDPSEYTKEGFANTFATLASSKKFNKVPLHLREGSNYIKESLSKSYQPNQDFGNVVDLSQNQNSGWTPSVTRSPPQPPRPPHPVTASSLPPNPPNKPPTTPISSPAPLPPSNNPTPTPSRMPPPLPPNYKNTRQYLGQSVADQVSWQRSRGVSRTPERYQAAEALRKIRQNRQGGPGIISSNVPIINSTPKPTPFGIPTITSSNPNSTNSPIINTVPTPVSPFPPASPNTIPRASFSGPSIPTSNRPTIFPSKYPNYSQGQANAHFGLNNKPYGTPQTNQPTNTYSYNAKSATGKDVSGRIQAATAGYAKTLVESQGNFAVSLKKLDMSKGAIKRTFESLAQTYKAADTQVQNITGGRLLKAGTLKTGAKLGLGVAAAFAPTIAESYLGTAKQPGVYGAKGARAGSAIGGAVTGGATGAFVGMQVGGPVGAAVGGLTGAIVGAIGAVKGFDEELRGIRLEEFEKNISKINYNSRGEFSTKGDEQQYQKSINSALPSMEEIRNSERSDLTQGKLLAKLPFSSSRYEAEIDKTRTDKKTALFQYADKDTKERLSNFGLESYKKIAQANPELSHEQIIKKGGTTKTAFGDLGLSDLLRLAPENLDIAMNYQKSVKKAKALQDKLNGMAEESVVIYEALQHNLEEYEKSVHNAAEGFTQRGAASNLAGTALQGQVGGIHSNLTAGNLKDPFSQDLHGFAKEGGGYDQARQHLIKLIGTQGRNVKAGQDNSLKAGQNIADQFGASGVGGAMAKPIQQHLQTILSGTTDLGQAVQGGGAADLADKVLAPFKGTKETYAKTNSQLNDVYQKNQQAQASTLNRRFQLDQNISESQGLTTEQALNQSSMQTLANPYSTSSSKLTANRGKYSKEYQTVGKTAEERELERNSQIQKSGFLLSQSQILSGTGLENNGGNASALKAGIGQENTNIAKLSVQQDKAQKSGSVQEFNALGKEILNSQDRMRRLSTALDNLGKSTIGVDVAQKKYSIAVDKYQADFNSRTKDADTLTFGSKKEQKDLYKKEALTQHVLQNYSPEQFQQLPDSVRKQVGERLKETEGQVRTFEQYDKYGRFKGTKDISSTDAIDNLRQPAMSQLQSGASQRLAQGVNSANRGRNNALQGQKEAQGASQMVNEQNINKSTQDNQSNFTQYLADINKSIADQMASTSKFLENSASLVDAMNSFPRNIEITRSGQVEVILNGGALILAAKEQIESEVMSQIIDKLKAEMAKANKKDPAF